MHLFATNKDLKWVLSKTEELAHTCRWRCQLRCPTGDWEEEANFPGRLLSIAKVISNNAPPLISSRTVRPPITHQIAWHLLSHQQTEMLAHPLDPVT